MPTLKIAHVKDQGVNIIIVPLAAAFQRVPEDEKERILEMVQARATAENLNGRVVPVWPEGANMRFMAPPAWHQYFQREVKMKIVRANLNRELVLDDLADDLDPREDWPAPPVPLLTRIAAMIGFKK